MILGRSLVRETFFPNKISSRSEFIPLSGIFSEKNRIADLALFQKLLSSSEEVFLLNVFKDNFVSRLFDG